MRRKTIGLYAFLIAFNIAAWIWAVLAFRGHPVLLSTAILAYTFGLRHAFDVDHIAAIDTVTRKLMQQNKSALTVGFHFAIGHSMTIFVGTLIVIATWSAATGGIGSHENAAGGVIDGIKLPMVGTMISASFLLLMAVINLIIARSTYRIFKRVRNGGDYIEEEMNLLLNNRGFLSRIFRPLFRLVNQGWHMLPIGFLFGLGFDTATEISLLGIAGAEAAKGSSLSVILVFPTLFTAGMALMDTTDSVLMSGAYGWAFRKPIRKLYYNLTITTLSAMVALLIGSVEAVSLISEKFNLQGTFWDSLSALNSHWGTIGFFIVALFLGSWLISTLVYRAKGYDYVDLRSPNS